MIADLEGRLEHAPLNLAAEFIVVGSGPAGATAALKLAKAGARVLILEEGEAPPHPAEASALRAMRSLYREFGTSVSFGNLPMPYLQGRALGGTSVINGAISWRLPETIAEEWYAADPKLEEELPFAAITETSEEIERALFIAPTDPRIAHHKNLRMAEGAARLGVAHRPIARNVRGCKGSGRCLQGCPYGAKLSMDRSFLPEAQRHGARVMSGAKVKRILYDSRGAYGVRGTLLSGARFEARASHGVILAASAIGTPTLLLESGIRSGPVGEYFSAHPGLSMTALFEEPIEAQRGATQGHEVYGYLGERIKLEVLGFDLGLLMSRLPGYGRALAASAAGLDHYAVYGAALRTHALGRVRSRRGRPLVRYSLERRDLAIARRALYRLGELFFAAGAREVYPGVPGFRPVLQSPAELGAIEREIPLEARRFTMSMTHLFGTTRMGSDPSKSVVNTRFEHHQIPRLFIVDSGVFPSNIGVNPQLPIMAIASIAAEKIASRG